MKKLVVLLCFSTLTACAVNSGVIPMGDDTFMVSRQGAVINGTGNLKAEALGEANQYCAAQKKSLHVMNAAESQPPYIFGNYPKAEVQFTCASR